MSVADRVVVVEQDARVVLVVEPTRTEVTLPGMRRTGSCDGIANASVVRWICPWRGRTVRLRVHTRRWLCNVPVCPRNMFAASYETSRPRRYRATGDSSGLMAARSSGHVRVVLA